MHDSFSLSYSLVLSFFFTLQWNFLLFLFQNFLSFELDTLLLLVTFFLTSFFFLSFFAVNLLLAIIFKFSFSFFHYFFWMKFTFIFYFQIFFHYSFFIFINSLFLLDKVYIFWIKRTFIFKISFFFHSLPFRHGFFLWLISLHLLQKLLHSQFSNFPSHPFFFFPLNFSSTFIFLFLSPSSVFFHNLPIYPTIPLKLLKTVYSSLFAYVITSDFSFFNNLIVASSSFIVPLSDASLKAKLQIFLSCFFRSQSLLSSFFSPPTFVVSNSPSLLFPSFYSIAFFFF